MEKATEGAEVVHVIKGNTYKDRSTVIVTPTRGMVHVQVVDSWNRLLKPKNQRVSHLYSQNNEVGVAYNEIIQFILEHEKLGGYKYLMTLEDDNVPPPSALMRLLDCMEQTDFDGVGLLYYTKGDDPQPMAYGNPLLPFDSPRGMDFSARDVSDAVMEGGLIEVNGIAMGCSIYRMDLFREMPGPWFITLNEWDTEEHALISGGEPRMGKAMTQDLAFCERARRLGKRFAVDCSRRVGHLDVSTEKMY